MSDPGRGTGPRLVVATGNPGKVAEVREALSGLDIDLASAHDVGILDFPPETGSTYEANARGKALHAARISGLPALADDSGLEVAALGGAPGVHSARFGGDIGPDAQIELLLAHLDGIPENARRARFVCAIVLATPGGMTETFHGETTGRISDAPRGDEGFGYDPVFISDELGMGFAEATTAEKRRVSHRGRALADFATWARTPAGRAALRAAD